MSVVKKFKLEPIELFYVQNDIQGGYSISDGEDVEVAIEKMLNAHNKFLAEALILSSREINKAKDKTTLERLSVLNDQFVSASNEVKNGRFTINGMQVNNNQNISKMKKAGIVNSVTPITQVQKIKVDLFNLQNQFNSAIVKSASHESWAPYAGVSGVNQMRTFQTFYFDNTNDFGSTSTYEHETQVYNKNFADYDGYWNSNLPRAYRDTQFLDTIDNFTVGSAQASSIQTNSQYFTYIGLHAGSASSATVRIKGQKGHRWPSWCYSTWCIFADATTSSMSTFMAPGGMSWWY